MSSLDLQASINSVVVEVNRCFKEHGIEAIEESVSEKDAYVAPAIEGSQDLARFLDHTVLKPDAVASDILKLCQEAKEYNFAAVCVNPVYAELATVTLKGAPSKVASVIGFPLGASTAKSKSYEALCAFEDGANEIDMVINIGFLKSKAYHLVYKDIKAVVDVAKKFSDRKALVKVIIETSLLEDSEKIAACLISKAAGADFVKTSTGFSVSGATKEDVELMRQVVGAKMGVKASGGIRTKEQAMTMIRAGANRLGVSASLDIVSE